MATAVFAKMENLLHSGGLFLKAEVIHIVILLFLVDDIFSSHYTIYGIAGLQRCSYDLSKYIKFSLGSPLMERFSECLLRHLVQLLGCELLKASITGKYREM
jgi:hypothetical protein